MQPADRAVSFPYEGVVQEEQLQGLLRTCTISGLPGCALRMVCMRLHIHAIDCLRG